MQQADAEIIERLNTADSDIQANLDANVANEGSIIALQGRADTHDRDIAKLKSDVALLQSGSGSSDGVDASQMEAEVKMLERCLLGGALVEIAGVIPASLTRSAIILDEEPSSCEVYFVEGSSASDSGFGFRPGIQPTYYSDWNATGKYAKANYNPVDGMVLAYITSSQKLVLFQQDVNETIGWKYHFIGATDKATFDAIRARYTAVEDLRTTTAGHETRIATLETDVAALKAGSGSSGSGSSGTTAEVMKVDVGALDSLCSSVEVAKSLIQHAEKMRYVVTATSGGVTIAVGELVMYADAGGKQVTQELRSHYLITGNNISSAAVRLDAMNTFCRSFGVLSTNNSYSTVGAWTFWRPKDGVIQLGESDVTTNSYMQDNVPTLLKLPLICGNKYITRIVFTVTKNNLTHSGIVDQQVSGTTCMQRLSMDSRLFTRYIYFTDDSRGILKGNPQGWQYSEPRNLSYDQRTGLLKMTNMWGNNVGSSVTLQLSNDSTMGLVPAGTLSKLGTLYGAQQRTWALNEPALQFDFFEKHPKDVDGTMPVLRGYGTSFRMCSYDASEPQNISWEDINQNVFFHIPAACPTTYTYNGVTYDNVSRYFALFRKYKRSGNRRYKKIVGNNYKAKRKQGYIEYLRTHGNAKMYGEYQNSHNTAGDVNLMMYMDDFPNIFCKSQNKSGIFSHGTTQNLRNTKDGNSGFVRTVSRISIGICLVLKCEKTGQKPLFVYGPLLKGHLLSIHITSEDNPHGNTRIADMYFKRA